MRFARTFVLAFLSLLLAFYSLSPGGAASAQQTHSSNASDPQGVALLHRSLAALTGGQSITDVTLSGTARRIAGSDDESGTATLKALAGTGVRLDLSLPSGPRSEFRNTSGPEPEGSRSGPDGNSHAISYHNLLTDTGWCPVLTIAALLSAQNGVINYLGPESRNGQAVIHISSYQQFPLISAEATVAKLMQHLTETEIYLDASTNLPAAISFNTHADGNANLDIPVEIRFSNYTAVNGAQFPFHVQESLNNSLLLDLQFTNAQLNSGLSASLFNVQ